MLLIVTVALVLAGVVLIVFGYVDNSLGLIYLALGSVGLAALTLIALALSSFGTSGRRRDMATVGSPVPDGVVTVDRGLRKGSITRDPTESRSQGAERSAGTLEEVAAAPGNDVGIDGVTDLTSAGSQRGISGRDREPVFPIEDYDELGVAEVFPLIGELEPDELIEVRTHELATKARGTVLRRIEARLAEAGFHPPWIAQEDGQPGLERSAAKVVAASIPLPVEAIGAMDPSAADDRAGDERADDDRADDEASEPIPGYSSMRAGQILPLLASLSPDDLARAAIAERSGARRSTILTRIARLEAAASGGSTPGHPVLVPATIEGGSVPAVVGRLTVKKSAAKPSRPALEGPDTPVPAGSEIDGVPSDADQVPRT